MALGMLIALPALPAQAATTSELTLQVVSARTEPRALDGAGVTKGDAVDTFRYIINVDNTGTTEQRSPAPGTGCSADDPGYPASCTWPSISEVPHASPIYTQGDQGDLTGGQSLDLPDGRYLISVLADGFKIDGAHFTMPLEAPGLVTVAVQPNPLPDSTLRAQVFADIAPTNGAIDQGDEGLAGFVGHINDTLGEVTTDVYGNPLCTKYVGEDPVTHVIPDGSLDGDRVPVIETIGGECISDSTGMLTIPHLGSNRYAMSAIPPDGQTWIQTTTLEGNHDFDAWLMEGATGYDTEFAIAGEPVPQPIFGFAPPTNTLTGGTGHIKGVVMAVKQYTPPRGGDVNFWMGMTGSKADKPIVKPWLSLADLQAGDEAVYVGQGNADGSFDIGGVPDGNYMLSWWDEPQNYFLNLVNVTVSNGEVVEMGNLPINGWWTEYEGYIFNDTDRDGVKDPGEVGIPNFPITMRKKENSLIDRGQNAATTDANGYYHFESTYPLGEWTVMEAYSDSFYTTGITYQADNQPDPTTVKGAGVDVSVLNIIGLGGRLDWGVHAYDPAGRNGIDPRNGGIVGSISYDTTRNELDPQYAAAEDWQPGVSGIPVELWATVPCGTTTAPCDAFEQYELAADGSYAHGKLLNTSVSEEWSRPTGCVARDVDGNALVHGVDENVLVPTQGDDGECLSSFLQSVQFGPYPTDVGTADANFGAAVDGNYGFGDGCFNGTLDATDPSDPACVGGTFTALGSGDYLVKIVIPDDALGRPMYQVTGEEDINIGHGDQIVPQVPPPACAGALHTVDVAGAGDDGYAAVVGDGGVTNDLPVGVTVPASVPVENATFLDIGGSPYEGGQEPRCDTKLVRVNHGKSVVPMFNVFTDVPIPSRMRGLIVDDINFSTDPRSTLYGEKAGVPFAPVGIYDFTNRMVYTLESDFNGAYDVLMPSTDHISCPTPSGICTNMYRFVGNDPGIPGRLNPNFNPRYRTIAAEFEAIPGVIIPTDLAPTQVGVSVATPTTGVSQSITCALDAATPQLFAVSKPFVDGSGTFSIEGTGFGASQGAGVVQLDGTTALPTTSWSNTHIDVTVPSGTATGVHQLTITADNGQRTVNGLTFHVRGSGYNPNLYEVGPGKTYATIQSAIDAAYASNGNDLVVVYPGEPDLANPFNNPRGAYYENLVMASPVKLQGVGPGGFQGNTFVPGSIIDAGAFGGDTDLATAWWAKVDSLTWDGNQAVNDGEAIYVLASQSATTGDGQARQFTSSYKAAIDGFDIRGGVQQGFPGNINNLPGDAEVTIGPNVTTQGGAIFANAYARHLQITNNVVENNGGGYGTIRIGTPDLPAPDTSQHNENVRIVNNRIIANAGTNLAGGIGLYAGSDNYEVASNDICGNFSLEYGGGLTVYGLSPNGTIHHNNIYFNNSNDEGGGIMIAGELPATAGDLSPGAGPVQINANRIQANLANDDGGGIRFLMAGNYPMTVTNNMIVNNVSTHEGGGIGINDAPDVRVVNNTIMKNLTTGTAVTSNGQPMPAGLSTSANSVQLQATLPEGSPTFSDPTLFNNVFWDNRAGTRAGTTVTGIGLTGDATPVDQWDLGVGDGTGVLAPTNSVVQQSAGTHPYTTSPSNSTSDPLVASTYPVSVSFATWRQNPGFVDATLVTLEAPPSLLGDYHLSGCPASPACELGAPSAGGVNAPVTDFDDQARPSGAGFDSGADEVGAAPVTPVPDLYFSTLGATNPPGVSGPSDNSDIYRWDGTAFTRELDLTAAPYNLLNIENADGYARVDATHFYMSFANVTIVPGVGLVNDEDIVYWNGAAWTMWFDGSEHGLNAGIDLGAISIVGNTLYFSTNNNAVPPGAGGTGDNADVYRWDGPGNVYTRVVDATAAPYGLPNTGSATGATNPNVDGLIWVDNQHFYLSFSNADTNVPGLGFVQDEDVVYFDSGTWSVWFDGTSAGLTSNNLDIDAISFAGDALPPLPPPPPATAGLFFSTLGSVNPPGVGGNADRTDIYNWHSATFTRSWDASASGVTLSTLSNVDGYDRVDAKHFYVSFSVNTRLKGLGTVQDEDIVYYNNGKWSLYFDGSAHGLTAPGADIDAFNIVGQSLYFSTLGNVNPPGVTGRADDADIYRWNGRSYARVWDATANGFASAANVDGFVRVNATHFYLSFSPTTTRVPGLGNVQDEDVVYNNAGRWSVYFDGTAHGLTSNNLDLDAFDLVVNP